MMFYPTRISCSSNTENKPLPPIAAGEVFYVPAIILKEKEFLEIYHFGRI
jgi:hypothetical protein